ncbi:hypothetical protein A9Q90_07425 [Gammaproteobacteria bacterium 54_18_T64]|nr:hypothetical protein A9Q90_07425 [Gammaproteobacteria bacterium 54_18_T64]
MEDRFKVLIIEQEDSVREGLVSVFKHHHFDVEAVENGAGGHEKAHSGEFDLLLLDTRVDEAGAFEFCAELRASHPGQVVFMLTADSDDRNLIDHMAMGADDFTSVPFAYTDLVQRAKALLRRSRLQGKTPRTEPMKLGDSVEIDSLTLSGQSSQGELAFTSREMRVLEYLYDQRGKTIEAQELLNQVWGYPRYLNTETRTVSVHIATLVNKIERDPEDPQFLKRMGEQSYQLSI